MTFDISKAVFYSQHGDWKILLSWKCISVSLYCAWLLCKFQQREIFEGYLYFRITPVFDCIDPIILNKHCYDTFLFNMPNLSELAANCIETKGQSPDSMFQLSRKENLIVFTS